jgi:hypothetical protein
MPRMEVAGTPIANPWLSSLARIAPCIRTTWVVTGFAQGAKATERHFALAERCVVHWDKYVIVASRAGVDTLNDDPPGTDPAA